MPSYDVIVAGLGGMGSAAAYRLAQRGLRVLGLERYTPVHDQGSSHGGSRITRQAYFEDPAYVPLLLRAAELWPEVEAASGRTIVHLTGGVMVGRADSRTVAGSLRSAQEWGLPHELLDAAEIRRRFPTMTPAPDEVALYERGAGLVIPEESVAAHLALASESGAELHFREPVTGWQATGGGGVRVSTAAATYPAGQLVACPGAWAPGLLAGLGVPFGVERQVQYWFAPAAGPEQFRAERHPIYIWEADGGRQFYGFPSFADPAGGPPGGVKVAFFRGGQPCTPATIERTVRPGRNRRDAGLRRTADAGSARDLPQGRDVHVHQHPGRAFRDRPASRARTSDRGVRLLRARVQVRARGRGDPRRPGRQRRNLSSHRPVRSPAADDLCRPLQEPR